MRHRMAWVEANLLEAKDIEVFVQSSKAKSRKTAILGVARFRAIIFLAWFVRVSEPAARRLARARSLPLGTGPRGSPVL